MLGIVLNSSSILLIETGSLKQAQSLASQFVPGSCLHILMIGLQECCRAHLAFMWILRTEPPARIILQRFNH